MDISMLMNPLKRAKDNIFDESAIKRKYQRENESSSNDCQIISENIPSNPSNLITNGNSHNHQTKCPILPPSLNTKEKLKILQEWVNSIPSDSPLDTCCGGTSSGSRRSNSITIASDEREGARPLDDSAGVTSEADLIPVMPMSGRERLQQTQTSKKLFTAMETQHIVQLFCHHFKHGTLPSVTEVRQVLQTVPVGLARTPESVRAKIRRLQVTGNWANYMGKNIYTL